MISSTRVCLGAIVCTFGIASLLYGDGFKGGGHGRGPGGGGGGGNPPSMGHMGGGGGRPNMGAGMSRPSMGNGMSRPNMGSRPNIGSPNIGSPVQRPNPGMSRPTNPSFGGNNRPNPGGGMSVGPGTFPGKLPPNQSGGMKPSFPNPRPGQGNGVNPNPSTRPENGAGNRPDIGYRPPNRPSNPDMGNGRPGRPGVPPNKLPNTRPGNRPGPGDVGDWLGIGPINRPGNPGINPGNPGTRPGTPGNRPGGPGAPGTRPNRPYPGRPDYVRPNQPGNKLPGQLPNYRPGVPNGNKRPINVGQINVNKNNNLYYRPSWAKIDNNHINSINNRWNNQMVGMHGWYNKYPSRVNYWNNWGSNVRHNWNWHSYHNHWYNGNWWYAHSNAISGWHYYNRFNYYPWSYWWSYPTWSTFGNWFSWNAPATVWSQPVYYDYGTGGNVTYQNNYVYMNGQQIASADEFAQSAATLATVAPPASQQQADDADWLPLGTFALSTGENDLEPSRTLQLAVNRDGIIGGTLYNVKTDQAQAIQGKVDSQTQRVAFRLGNSEDIVAETGLYNLTQDSAPLLVHFGTDRVENYNLVRLTPPDDEDQ